MVLPDVAPYAGPVQAPCELHYLLRAWYQVSGTAVLRLGMLLPGQAHTALRAVLRRRLSRP
eukprot:3523655-Rhodomonas_salina.1